MLGQSSHLDQEEYAYQVNSHKTGRQNQSFRTDSNLGFACLRLDKI